MRIFSFFLFVVLMAATPSFATVCIPDAKSAAPMVCIGKPCSTLGQSMMDGDQKSIIFCLRNDIGELYWGSPAASIQCQDYTYGDPSYNLVKTIGGASYPLCFDGAGYGGADMSFPIAAVAAQAFCEEKGYKMSFVKSAVVVSNTYAVTHQPPGDWIAESCAVKGLVARCCK